MKDVLFIDQFSEIGGAQRCLLDLIPAVVERGWKARALLPGPGLFADSLRTLGVAVDFAPCGPYQSGHKSPRDLVRFVVDLPALVRAIRRLVPADLVYVNGPRPLPAAALAIGARVPILFHGHSYLDRRYAAGLVGRSLKRTRSTAVANCQFVAQPLRRYVPVQVIYNGVPPGSAAIGRERRGPWRIGIIGRIAPEKGQIEFLQAARILHEEVPECRFVICGAPMFSNAPLPLEALARGLSVEFVGWREDVAAVLGELDLLVAPSTRVEATTRVILEAFAAGVPVVAFRAGGIPEIVADEETGFLVDPPEPRALAARLHGLIHGAPHRLAEVARNALDAWRERFTLERYRREMIEQMVRAASGTPTPR